jgi:hypothetical protein
LSTKQHSFGLSRFRSHAQLGHLDSQPVHHPIGRVALGLCSPGLFAQRCQLADTSISDRLRLRSGLLGTGK